MKLITLNAWGGRVWPGLKNFIESRKNEIDIFCFQEIYKQNQNSQAFVQVSGREVKHDLFEQIRNSLENHNYEFCDVLEERYGIATYINKKIEVLEKGDILIAKGNWEESNDVENRDHDRKLQWFDLLVKGSRLRIMNTHFTHRPEGKSDSEKRLNQSKIVVDLIESFDGPQIIVGDFNLLPNTQSMQMLEDIGLKNLIKEYNIISTRTELYKKTLKFADYIFCSPEIIVRDFKVLADVVSDHNPLYLEFDLI
jgi:endonuclease/exonuclease/phosphatase family metal-dependent hydrolase